MERQEKITGKILIHIRWTCGDGCCSDSNAVEIFTDKVITADDVCKTLDQRDYVYTSHYPENLRFEGQENGTTHLEYDSENSEPDAESDS